MSPLEPVAVRGKVAAQLVGVCQSELLKWRRTGVGPPYLQLNRVVMYPLNDLKAWVARNSIDPADDVR